MKISCEFGKGLCTIYLNKYTCTVTSASICKPNSRVKSYNGKHASGKNDHDVKAIKFENQVVEHFPRNLHKIFPQLESLFISNCGLKAISRRDLIGLENISGLGIFSNQLTSLPSDLFVDMPKLRNISFIGNKLGSVSSKIFAPIIGNGLTYVDFRKNPSINSVYGVSSIYGVESLEKLMEVMDDQCTPPVEAKNYSSHAIEKLSKGFQELWMTGRLSDLILIVGDEKFRVHKNVLAIQSSVFRAIFENDMMACQTNEMRIDEYSSETVTEFLRYMYTGEIPGEKNCLELFSLATKYDVSELRRSSEQMLMENLDESNALELFDLGHRHGSQQLKALAFNEITSMFPEATLDCDLINHPESLKELMEAKLKYYSILSNSRQKLSDIKD